MIELSRSTQGDLSFLFHSTVRMSWIIFITLLSGIIVNATVRQQPCSFWQICNSNHGCCVTAANTECTVNDPPSTFNAWVEQGPTLLIPFDCLIVGWIQNVPQENYVIICLVDQGTYYYTSWLVFVNEGFRV